MPKAQNRLLDLPVLRIPRSNTRSVAVLGCGIVIPRTAPDSVFGPEYRKRETVGLAWRWLHGGLATELPTNGASDNLSRPTRQVLVLKHGLMFGVLPASQRLHPRTPCVNAAVLAKESSSERSQQVITALRK